MKITRKIVAIGGGELNTLETADIDKRIIELTGKTRPKALFIPTASGDAEGYVETFEACYGDYYRVLTSTPNAKAYKLFKRNGRAIVTELPQDSEYTALSDLLKRK